MQLIKSIHIERFRSLANVRLDDLSDIVALVGPNNCGKSNILRALNLFFNDETEKGQLLDFARDYHLSRSRRAKEIKIAVEFALPETFKFRKGLESVEEFLGRTFILRKTWTVFSPFEALVEYSVGSQDFVAVTAPEDALNVRQFLDLIEFRYVPNRAIPVTEIREASPGLLRNLARRIANYRKKDVAPLFEAIHTFATNIVEPIARDLKESCMGIEGLELATPTGPFELLFSPGFRASVGPAGSVDDHYLGSGVQSLLMFHVLHLVDSYGFQNFGWRQAAVWAVEEPESSLHRDLQVHLASLFRSYAEMKDRFQIFNTTHNEVFIYSATSAYELSTKEGTTQAVSQAVSVAAQHAASLRITGTEAPPLKFLFNTVVMVEGDHDAAVLSRAAELSRVGNQLHFATPRQLDDTCPDGVDGIYQFLTRHAGTFERRLPAHPLLIILDWDTPDGKFQSIVQRYAAHGATRVRRMDPSQADARVDESFRGIERFYPPELLEEAENNGVIHLGHSADDSLMVTPHNLGSAKVGLRELFVEQASRKSCRFLRPILEWAEAERLAALGAG